MYVNVSFILTEPCLLYMWHSQSQLATYMVADAQDARCTPWLLLFMMLGAGDAMAADAHDVRGQCAIPLRLMLVMRAAGLP